MIEQEFMEEVRNSIADYMGGDTQVTLKTILKNNSVTLNGLLILEKGKNITPTIYLDRYYQQFENGREFSNIVYEIIGLYEKHKEGYGIDVEFFADYQQTQDKIVCKLVNYENNQELLKEIPYIRFLDLAIIFYCLIMSDNIGSAVILIYNRHMELWNVTLEELYEKAKSNTRKLLGCRIRRLADVLQESLIENMESDLPDLFEHCEEAGMTEGEKKEFVSGMVQHIFSDEGQMPMFVMSNQKQLNGAVCMIYPDILKDFAEEMERDLYIIPSSIHEVLLLPTVMENDADRLSEMVREVNATQVEADEVLANHIYFFSRMKQEVSVL